MNLISTDDLSRDLENRGVRFTQLSLSLPDSTTFEEWSEIGKKLCRAEHVMTWWIADWAAFGHKQWGKVKEFAEANNWVPKTVYNAARVAKIVESSRRREDLSFGHHEAVSLLPEREQSKWLEKAHLESWPIGSLRREIRTSLGRFDATKPDGPALHFAQGKSVTELLKWLQARPQEFWDDVNKAYWRSFLEPIVTFWMNNLE